MPENLSITAQVPENKEKKTPQLGPVTITVNSGKTVAEMLQLFGEEAVKTNAEANWIVTLQSNIRAGLRRGETQAQIQERLKSAKMGVAQKGIKVDPVQAYMAKFATATPEEQQKMLKELQARAAKK